MTFDLPKTGMLLERLGLLPGGAVQAAVDRSAAAAVEPYVPYDTGALKNAPAAHIGEGALVFDLPYARRQYYENTGEGYEGLEKGGLRGAYFFDRMKADQAETVLLSAARQAGVRARR